MKLNLKAFSWPFDHCQANLFFVVSISFRTLVKSLPPLTFIGILVSTTLVYVFMDIVPIYRFIPSVEPQIAQVLWQSVLWGLHSVFIAFYVCHGIGVGLKLHSDSFFKFFFKYFNEFLAARLRVLIRSSLWFLVFIIPGFIMLLRYSLSEMIVFFNPNFLEDRTQDPLLISKQKIGFKFVPLGLLSLFYFVIPMFLDSSFEHANLLHEPSGRVFQILMYTILILLSNFYLFWAFTHYQEKNNV